MFLFSILIASECELVINLARGLNMGNAKDIKMSDLENDCCNTALTGVTCENTGVVKVIQWGYSNLQLDGSINGSAIPPQLVLFNVHINRIKGEMPVFPNSIRNLYLYGNNINGSITRFPSEGYDIRLQNNLLTGEIPFITSKITLLYLDFNLLTGNLPLLPLFELNVGANLLTGSLPSLPNMGKGWFSGNFLSGPLSYINPSIYILHLGSPQYATNNLSGVITSNRPTEIMIYNNSITSVLLYDTSVLNLCDIGYNPISYQNALLYPMCSKEGIDEKFTSAVTTELAVYTTEYSQQLVEHTTGMSELTIGMREHTEMTTTIKFSSSMRTSTLSPLKTRIPIQRNTIGTSYSSITVDLTNSTTQYTTNYANMSSTASVELLTVNPTAISFKLFLSNPFSVMRMTINTIFFLYILSKAYPRLKKHRRKDNHNRQSNL